MTLPSESPLLVMGCPRSGTTLAAVLLESRLGFAVPAETQFVPYFSSCVGLWGDLSRAGNRRLLLDAIFQFLEIWIARALHGIPADSLLPQTLLATRPDAEAIVERACGYGDLVCGLFDAFAVRQGKVRWAEKSAYASPMAIERLERALRGARVVHLVRDSRDVCLSWRETDTPPPSLASGARMWRRHIRLYRAWGTANPERFLEIRYEDMVADPDDAARRIGHFLRLDPSPAPAESALARVVSSFPSQALLAGPVMVQSVGRWRAQMSLSDIRVVESVTGADLIRLGHALSGHRADLSTAARRALGRLAPLASAVSWRRGAKASLPLAIRLAQTAGLRLPSLLGIEARPAP